MSKSLFADLKIRRSAHSPRGSPLPVQLQTQLDGSCRVRLEDPAEVGISEEAPGVVKLRSVKQVEEFAPELELGLLAPQCRVFLCGEIEIIGPLSPYVGQ